jgi:hypothetical protein
MTMGPFMRVVQAVALGALISPLALEAAHAGALPPPPYAADAAYGATAPASDAGTLDRYGGGLARPAPRAPANRYAFPVPAASAQGGAAPGGMAQGPVTPKLSWAGKAVAATRSGPQAPDAADGWRTLSGRWVPPTPAGPPLRTADAAPASAGWRPLATPAPRSIYDAPAQPQAQGQAHAQTQAQAQNQPQGQPGGPRFYSLHRDYGIQPDAIPIPPQFFGPTADLSAPPADPAVKRVTTASGQTRAVAVADDSAP